MEKKGVKNLIEDINWLRFLEEEPELLIEYLESTYRPSLWVELPALLKEVESHCRNKTLCYPQLEEALLHLRLVNSTFSSHLSEEAVLFDMLKKTGKKSGTFQEEERQTLRELISLMEQEHTLVIEGFSRVRVLCNNYLLPIPDPILPGLYARMERCEFLMLEQIYLESKLLFEKVIRSKQK